MNETNKRTKRINGIKIFPTQLHFYNSLQVKETNQILLVQKAPNAPLVSSFVSFTNPLIALNAS